MKIILIALALVFLFGCTYPAQEMEDRVGELESENDLLKEQNDIYKEAESKRITRLLLDGQTNRQLLKDTKELLLNMWQASTICGEYVLCDSACDFGEYSKSDYLDLCNAYYYSFTQQDYDEIELRLEEALE